ncbi:MAG TPA: ribose 5-phosphate isomerase B [Actinobacteria bacterium]|nr:ribose 5-phosphate isomerase B [Actinomycetota bacterium]
MHKDKKIFTGSDHAGFDLKEKIKGYLSNEGIDFEDMGAPDINPADDYPDYAAIVAKKVAENNGAGILVCSSGTGMCITANKIKGIRAVNAFNAEIAEMSRIHNDTNVLCLGQDYIPEGLAIQIVRKWLETDFSGVERHQRRVDKIAEYENQS